MQYYDSYTVHIMQVHEQTGEKKTTKDNPGDVPKNRKRKRATQEMKDILKSGEWLTDEHIMLSQELLRSQFPQIGGLQSPLLAENDGFSPITNTETNDAIQIHHVNQNHWVMSSSIRQQVTVYDSKFSGGDLSSSLTHQLALILA